MDKVVGYTAGVFDMFHVGHLRLLRRSRAMCDYLVVGATTDEFCELAKGKRPVVPCDERMEILKSVRFVDEVVPQTDYDKFAAWQRIGFDVMFVGDDWKGTPRWRTYEEEFGRFGVQIRYLPYTQTTSSSLLREKLLA